MTLGHGTKKSQRLSHYQLHHLKTQNGNTNINYIV